MARKSKYFMTIGLFIIDEFRFLNPDGSSSGQSLPPQMGGNGIYAAMGARIWVPPDQVGMVIKKGSDFPADVQVALEKYGKSMWNFKQVSQRTTRSLSTFQNGQRHFQYLTERPVTSLSDVDGERPRTLHFHCMPTEAITLFTQMDAIQGWAPVTIYEPHPMSCNPANLAPLLQILPRINIFSPNSTEAFALLAMTEHTEDVKGAVERAAANFLQHGVGPEGKGYVIIRCHAFGAYIACRQKPAMWVDAYWSVSDGKVVDPTGAGNAFLGGLAAGLYYAKGDVYEALFYATVSSSFIIEQAGLPKITRSRMWYRSEEWNGDSPRKRLKRLKEKCRKSSSVQ